MMETKLLYHEAIRCPTCKVVQLAEVRQATGAPYWLSLVHECPCGYIITESEWDKVPEWKGNPS